MVYYIIAAIAVVLIVLAAVIYMRVKRFKPNADKAVQLKRLNDDIHAAGFAYDYGEDQFYSLKDCWQREAGYCRLYDEGSSLFSMIIDCEPVMFSYGGKRWLIELWKGQYGITTGAEIGIYNTTREDIQSDKFTGTFYEPISDNEQMDMSFVLYKNGKKLLRRKEHHWWLTAFKLGEFSETSELVMKAKIKFPSDGMRQAFTDALRDMGYSSREITVKRTTVSIVYTTPHSEQPMTQEGISGDAVQLMNKNNCKLLKLATGKYPDTLDKMEYIRSFMPDMYNFLLRSLYGKEFFKAFEWLIELIHGHKPPKPPEPPCEPCKPCKPCDSCKPCGQCAEELCRQRLRYHCKRMNKDNPGYLDYRRRFNDEDY